MTRLSKVVSLLTMGFCVAITGCGGATGKAGITKEAFPMELYTLTNANGMTMKVTNYGGIVTELWVPDKNGKLGDIVLGYDNLAGYLTETPYFGSLIGRYGNRIAAGKFKLDGAEYTLVGNNNGNALHGGCKGFDKVAWKCKPFTTDDGVGLELTYTSKDMEEGYPGKLCVNVTYLLNNKNEWKIDYLATTDKPTVVNLTQHSYFNLRDAGKTDNLGHVLMLNASKFLPTDKGLIPTGELRSVAGTPMDFTTPTAIGKRVNEKYEPLVFGGGYDHCWVLDKKGDEMSLAASVHEPTTGRYMEVWTTEPAIQFYGGNFLDGGIIGKGGVKYNFRNGFCLETQHYPDSPNHANFPSTVLRPGQPYKTTTIYKFSTK